MKGRKGTTTKYIKCTIQQSHELHISLAGFAQIRLDFVFAVYCPSFISLLGRIEIGHEVAFAMRRRYLHGELIHMAWPSEFKLVGGESKASERHITHTHLSRLCSLTDIRPVISGEPRHVVVYVQHFDERRCGGG